MPPAKFFPYLHVHNRSVKKIVLVRHWSEKVTPRQPIEGWGKDPKHFMRDKGPVVFSSVR